MEVYPNIKKDINSVWWLLRILYGVTFIGAGLDKFFGFVTNWQQFIHSSLLQASGLSFAITLIGIIEIVLGILVFTRWVKIASLLIILWMFANGIYLIFYGMYLDTAARYIALGICALAFFHITRIREKLMHV